jgi:hypothetical protein
MSTSARLRALAVVLLGPVLGPVGKGITRYLALQILRAMPRSACPCCGATPKEGYQRGADYYNRQELIAVLQNVLEIYWQVTGRFPDLLSPRLYSEKINHAKFFTPIKVPETGNKLLTASFLPPCLEGRVNLPEIVWHHHLPTLPDNDSLAPGDYYLKSSHGSGMVQRIRFPLDPAQRQALEATCAQWLNRGYGHALGEWWYNTFPPRLLIEKSVSARSPSSSMLFYVIGGEVAMITVLSKSLEQGLPDRRILLDANFHPHAIQDPWEKRLNEFQLAEPLKHECLEAARTIGRQFHSVRVDLMVGDDGKIYLNELTFSPNAGLPFVGKALDLRLGSLWQGACLWR